QEARRERRRSFDPPAWSTFREAARETRAGQAKRFWDRAWPHTGIDGTTLGVSFSRLGAAATLGGAIFDERLGDRRRNGFPGHTAFTFLRTHATLGTGGLVESRARLVGWRSLAPALEEEQGLLAPLGWEASV